MDSFVVAATCAVLGLAVGSFLNVVIWRVPRKEPVAAGRSRCPRCDEHIRARDLVPLVSWFALDGRCRDCDARIPARYPLVELGCAVLFGLVAVRFDATWELPAFLVLAATLLAVSVIDLEHYIVPNRIVFPVSALSVPLLALGVLGDGGMADLQRAVLAGLAGFAVLFTLHMISPRGLGMGDVRLAFVLGLYLGWLGWGWLALGLFLGFLLGAVIGLLLVVARLRARTEHIPFAPFLSAGAVVAVLWGQPLLDWYTG
jgi:leader peptidase (prepilin peptidase) / N-methyltransferase